MPNHRVDYDRIAPNYERRFASSEWCGVASALMALVQQLDPERILEVGCGTCRWLADMHVTTSQLYGLDLSRGMLKQAQRKPGKLYLIQGRARHLPFPRASFDLVFCVNALHHFDAQRNFVFEARRLLRSGGALAVVGMDPRGRQDRYYIYRYFEGTYGTDLERFPSWGTVLDWMAWAGFESVSWRLVERILDDKVGVAVLADPFLEKDATSQLALLSDDVYAEGLRRIRSALREAETAEESLIFPVDIPVGMVVGMT